MSSARKGPPICPGTCWHGGGWWYACQARCHRWSFNSPSKPAVLLIHAGRRRGKVVFARYKWLLIFSKVVDFWDENPQKSLNQTCILVHAPQIWPSGKRQKSGLTDYKVFLPTNPWSLNFWYFDSYCVFNCLPWGISIGLFLLTHKPRKRRLEIFGSVPG